MTGRAILLLLLALAPFAIFLTARETALPERDEAAPASFAEAFGDHLVTVREAADALVDLGERRERNLFVVSQRQSAMNSALDATDAWLAQQPARQDDPAVAAYRAGAAGIRQAMAEAQAAFFRLDWDGVAAANVTLKQGAADVSTAQDLVQAAGEN